MRTDQILETGSRPVPPPPPETDVDRFRFQDLLYIGTGRIFFNAYH
jgi:hypothetical protein